MDNNLEEENTEEFDFDGELIKHVVILNPSKGKEAWKRFFNSFSKLIGEEQEVWEIKQKGQA